VVTKLDEEVEAIGYSPGAGEGYRRRKRGRAADLPASKDLERHKYHEDEVDEWN
jgi:hypothetical protein